MRCEAGVLTFIFICIVVPSQSWIEIVERLKKPESCKIPELIDPPNSTQKIPTLRNFKRKILCILVQDGFMTVDGDFRLDFIRDKYYLGDPEKVEFLIKKCAIKRKTPEHTAFTALMCFFKHKMLKSEKRLENLEKVPQL